MFFSEGGFPKLNIFPISNFSQIRYRVGHQISNFSQIQKSSKHPGGGVGGEGGQENCELFPLIVTFFNWKASLRYA